ncbi:MAG: twitching motility protein PilI [Pseudomonadota bacterium]|jgi:twitching motility protein PilI|nr:twitching motility protein PilI [Pseudomonadota bacterium]MDQ5880954.1 twitching motility protein PilI [Pseudomonadota bacterium]MDQ5903414.1 twitching motility protein PilI [Pseudomonadota bacterium]MDQ5906232.1 twitching motility protein PilI [Pseudomonadota bacterium]MDQ5915733.1 twitching motility protein PilI [Pseudomonadota bacterium]
MAKKISLREFQEHLAARLTSAAQGKASSALLGVQTGADYWLLNLSDSGEIVPLPPLTTVPLTKPWFSGIANIRGNLYSVADFSALRGGEATPMNAASRLLLVGTRHGSNAALLVTRMLGLKNPDQFTAVSADDAQHPWEAEHLVDSDGRRWKKLNVRALLADPDFMEIGA